MNISSFFIIFSFICLLLYSITNLGKTIEENNQEFIKKVLNKFTNSIISSFITGIIVCLFTQSSSIITILTISLISGKVLSLKKGLSIIIGSNIGTTLVSLLVSLELGSFYFVFFIVGTILLFSNKKQASSIIIYIGLIFLTLDLLESNLLVFFDETFIKNKITKFQNPLLGILSGTISSFLIQSSSVTIALTQNMYKNNIISSILGISIMLGANIGTTISGLLFSINSSVDAKRVAVGSLLFNFFGVLLVIPFLYIYKEKITNLNNPYLISAMHIYFNIITGLLGIIFINPLTNLTYKIVKEKDIK